ncbi:hypothetical protein CAPTEDRAFT_228542 [Capitella teleta]|uniref:PDZ domain-containing protein n=1 Tax=Capitella teleta TaxID=283909 RepID=R7USF5_CAPTE|nr:hypothetical protein CAPTEDRAFT_228542 [Capitella teleta]|eukprot:ELU06857.1 hypothetical protein CAPTEDRAFT_228542 [Capitella teleta]
MTALVQLRRYDTSTPWGFRMNGGLEFGQPLYIQKVSPGSPSCKAGLRSADVILQIGQSPTQGMSHQQAKMEIIRAGNDVDFIVQRDGFAVPHPTGDQQSPVMHTPHAHSQPHYPPHGSHPDSGVVHEPHWRNGGALQDPSAQSMSFKMLQHELQAE